MKLRELPGYLRDTLLRMLPHRAPTGLVRIGNPGRDAPVLLTGNFTLTVRRLRQVLAGRDAWLLCANSKGINVWCAAGGGYLTHHDVISVIRTSGIEKWVDRRELILPQLCATGVEHRLVTEVTGWTVRWGPARLEDLPAFLDRGSRVHARERFMRFPLWERAEMAVMWGGPMLLLGGPVILWGWGFVPMLSATVAVVVAVGGPFVLLPWLDVRGPRRLLTHALFIAAGGGAGVIVLRGFAVAAGASVIVTCVAAAVAGSILALDLAGTTPWYGSTLNALTGEPHIDLVLDRCTGQADCVQVCPRDVLKMAGTARKVSIVHSGQCIACGACIVQCPEDALRFRYDDGRIVEPSTIRRTRLNLLGRRSVRVPGAG